MSSESPVPEPRSRRVGLGVALILLSVVTVLGATQWGTLLGAGAPQSIYRGSLTAGLPDGVVRARDYLNRVVDSRGRFIYLQYVDGRAFDAGAYNIVRHAGALYGLGMLRESGRLDAGTQDTILKGAAYLLRTNFAPVIGHPELAAIFSLPGEEVGKLGDERQAKLGGTALGILALLAARAIDPAAVPLEQIQALARFVLFMQEPDGHFGANFSETTGVAADVESLFYPGESMLALVQLYRVDGNVAWLEAAARGAAYVINSRQGQAPPVDHWLLIAADQLLDAWPALANPPIAADAIYQHVVLIANLMLGEQAGGGRQGGLPGGFSSDNTCTPTATRLEALVALERLASRRADTELLGRLRPAIADGGRFLLGCQVRGGPYDGGVLEAAMPRAGGSAADRAFNASQGSIRIDFVQHAMSALIGIDALCSRYDCSGH